METCPTASPWGIRLASLAMVRPKGRALKTMRLTNTYLTYPVDNKHIIFYFYLRGAGLCPDAVRRMPGSYRIRCPDVMRLLPVSGQNKHAGHSNNPNMCVPATTYLAFYENRIVGNIQIRHYLNDYLLNTYGHIGYSVRPSERRKGYATQMLALALKKCRKLGIDKVLISCGKDNVASVKHRFSWKRIAPKIK